MIARRYCYRGVAMYRVYRYIIERVPGKPDVWYVEFSCNFGHGWVYCGIQPMRGDD